MSNDCVTITAKPCEERCKLLARDVLAWAEANGYKFPISLGLRLLNESREPSFSIAQEPRITDYCPRCGGTKFLCEHPFHQYAVVLGRLGGKANKGIPKPKSAENGKKGGRPKGSKKGNEQ